MALLAFMTFGMLHEPWGHPRVQGFIDRIPDTFASASTTEGFVARMSEGLPGFGLRYYGPDEAPRAPQTLSLWADLESVYAFAYHGLHAEALRLRREWFVKPEWPTYVAWWVNDDHVPTWQEAYERLESLHDHGPSPFAFTFKTPFGADGQPTMLDRRRVDQKAPTVR